MNNNCAKIVAAVLVVIAMGWLQRSAQAIPFGGVEFPQGAVSFADSVVSFNLGPDSGPPQDDPNLALGIPDDDFVSLGDDGFVILQFTDNALTTSGDATPDLHIFEGGQIEIFQVEISTDGLSWIDLGNVSGQPTSIDIDPLAAAGVLYTFVRLTDVNPPNQTPSPIGEADIDAVGAISTVQTDNNNNNPGVPEPITATLALMGLGVLGMTTRRRTT